MSQCSSGTVRLLLHSIPYFSILDKFAFLSLSSHLEPSHCYSAEHVPVVGSLSSGNLVKVSTAGRVLLCAVGWASCADLTSGGHHINKATPVLHSSLIFVHALCWHNFRWDPHWCLLWGKGKFAPNFTSTKWVLIFLHLYKTGTTFPLQMKKLEADKW